LRSEDRKNTSESNTFVRPTALDFVEMSVVAKFAENIGPSDEANLWETTDQSETDLKLLGKACELTKPDETSISHKMPCDSATSTRVSQSPEREREQTNFSEGTIDTEQTIMREITWPLGRNPAESTNDRDQTKEAVDVILMDSVGEWLRVGVGVLSRLRRRS
jgi:hypothetical protein